MDQNGNHRVLIEVFTRIKESIILDKIDVFARLWFELNKIVFALDFSIDYWAREPLNQWICGSSVSPFQELSEIDKMDVKDRNNWWSLERNVSDLSELRFTDDKVITEKVSEGDLIGEMEESPSGEETKVDETDDNERPSEEGMSAVSALCLRAKIVGYLRS